MARRRDLFKSDSEIRADTLRRVVSKGRASFAEAGTILKWSQPRIRAYCDNGEMQSYSFGKTRYIALEELERWKGVP